MHRPCHRRTSHLQKLPCLRKLHTEELQRGDSGEEEDLCLPELPAGGPRPPVDAHNARQTFEQRVTREKLRRDIAQFTPHQVFRECLVLFDKHPEVYGPLWRLFEEEHRRIVAEKVSGQHCAVAGSLWGDLVGGHSQFQKEAKQRNRERVLAGQNQALRDEVAALTDKMERAEDDAIRWKASSDECMAVAEKLSGIVEALKADLADANQQVLRVTGKNLQLATVNETYAEGDERKLGEKQMMLLEEIDVLKSANEALILEMKSYRQEADERKADQSQAADDKTAANARVAELFRTIKRLTVENKALADERDQLNSMLSSSNSNGADITSSQPADDYIVESFIGRGNGAHIPKYLRWHGLVKNKRIRKGDLERIINDIWKEKALYTDPSVSLCDFFAIYLEMKYTDPARRAEQGYSILYWTERFRADADCEMFLAILRGEVPEQVWQDQIQLLQELKTAFIEIDEERNGGTTTGELPHSDIKSVLSSSLLSLTPWRFQALCSALKKDCDGGTVNYRNLFLSDKDGNQGCFLEEIRDQHLHSIQAYVADVCAAVYTKAIDETVSWGEIREAWLRVDPSRRDVLEDTLQSIAKVAGCPTPGESGLNSDDRLPFADFQATFDMVFVKRVGPDPTGGERKWDPAIADEEDEEEDDNEAIATDDQPWAQHGKPTTKVSPAASSDPVAPVEPVAEPVILEIAVSPAQPEQAQLVVDTSARMSSTAVDDIMQTSPRREVKDSPKTPRKTRKPSKLHRKRLNSHKAS